MISYYELLPESSIQRVRSELKREWKNGTMKNYLFFLVQAATRVGKSMFRKRLVTEEEYNEALSMIDPTAILNSIEKHCNESNNKWEIEHAVLNDFGANKERDQISKSVLLFLLILKIIITIIIVWWWKENKPDEELNELQERRVQKWVY